MSNLSPSATAHAKVEALLKMLRQSLDKSRPTSGIVEGEAILWVRSVRKPDIADPVTQVDCWPNINDIPNPQVRELVKTLNDCLLAVGYQTTVDKRLSDHQSQGLSP